MKMQIILFTTTLQININNDRESLKVNSNYLKNGNQSVVTIYNLNL